jgi:hypothetical protein
MTNLAIGCVLTVNNNFTVFADVVCRIQVLINEMIAWKRNRSEDKSILHCKSVMVAQQTAPPPAHTHTHTRQKNRIWT